MLTDSQRATLTARLRRGREDAASAIPRRPADVTEVPLSFAQEQLWFIDQLAPGKPTYNIPLVMTVSGPLDADALGRAISALVARHEVLRTRLVPGERGQPAQVIDPLPPCGLERRDMSEIPAPDQMERLREFVGTEALRPFELSAGPLLRTWLIRLADDSHAMVFIVHHTVFDGWSAGVLLRDVAALYRQEVTGEPSGLAELPVQFADYALWERGRLTGAALAELENDGGSGPSGSGVSPGGTVSPRASTAYWRGALAGLPTLHLRTDRPRPALEDFDGGLAVHMTGRDLLDGLRTVSREAGTTLFVTVMAGLQALLQRYTGQDDIVVGTVSASRARPELAPLIGFLVNTLPIRADLSGNPTFAELLDRVREATGAAYAHQDLPFAKIVDAAQAERDPSRSPLFQVILAYAERDTTPVSAGGAEFAMSELVVGIRAAKFDLDFTVEARADGLWFECSYKTALFDADTVQRLLGHLEVLLRGAVARPAAPISQLPVLTDAELRRELTEWNDTATRFPERCLHYGFADQVALTPEAVAASYEGEQLSYAELNHQANQIARRLRAAGVGPEVLVGVCMPTSLRRLAALLAIMKAGGGYVPLDPALPPDRLAFMITDTAMAVVLSDDPDFTDTVLSRAISLMARPATRMARPATRMTRPATLMTRPATLMARPATLAALSLDACWDQICQLDGTDLDDDAGAGPDPTGVTPANIAYVIYTSGSTGQPKGVVIEHRQVDNFIRSMIEMWRIDAADVVLQFASLGFDASVQELYMPLLAGATVVLAPPDTLHSAQQLAAFIRDHRVTITFQTPSVASLLRDEQFPDLRVLLCGGEEIPSDLVRYWLRPGLVLANDYGPTETTVSALFMVLEPDTPLPPPIGLPCQRGSRAYVLDAHLNPVPVGVTGELHIGGAGVARGYLGRPGLTAQRFIDDPFTPGQRLYKTGDLARRRPDGTVVFAGRIDHQVKLRGLRIELGEIETTLATHPHIAQAVVIVTTSPAGDKQLTAYIRPASGTTGLLPTPTPAAVAEFRLADVRAHLARTLPAYMIPAHLITIDHIPLTTNGKIDKAALPPPCPVVTEHAAPASGLEEVLIRCYGTVLKRSDIGATDSFFQAGGNSLQVMRLVDLIRAETSADVSAAAVFLHPAPRKLAAHIEATKAAPPGQQSGGARGVVPLGQHSPMVELSLGTGLPRLFLIHAVGGTVFSYADLAGQVADTFKVYGLEAPALSEPGGTAGSLADLVRDYATRIKATQPAGPYLLGGWSMGGIVALEVTRLLESQGAEVALLALLDAPFAVPPRPVPSQDELAAQFLADAAGTIGIPETDLPDPAVTTADRQLDWLAERLSADGADGADGSIAGAALLRRRLEVFSAHHQMLAEYSAAPAGRACQAVRAPTLIVSADQSLNAQFLADWPTVLGGPVSTLRVASDHFAFLRQPLVADVGAAIQKWHGEFAWEAVHG